MPFPVSAKGRINARPPVTGAGTITQLANDITGVNTTFLAQVAVGDRIVGGAINGIVTAVTNDTALVLSTSDTVAVGVAYEIRTG